MMDSHGWSRFSKRKREVPPRMDALCRATGDHLGNKLMVSPSKPTLKRSRRCGDALGDHFRRKLLKDSVLLSGSEPVSLSIAHDHACTNTSNTQHFGNPRRSEHGYDCSKDEHQYFSKRTNSSNSLSMPRGVCDYNYEPTQENSSLPSSSKLKSGSKSVCDRHQESPKCSNSRPRTENTNMSHNISNTLLPNGATKLLNICLSSDQNARLTLENFRDKIYDFLSCIKKYDLLPKLSSDYRSKVRLDPVEEYFSRCQSCNKSFELRKVKVTNEKRRSLRLQRRCKHASQTAPHTRNPPANSNRPLVKQSCEVKMRIKIQYKSHGHVLSNVRSQKDRHDERQFDNYFQAVSLLRARDSNCVVCDISFTDVTYLGAFWRDYTNGTLEKALKAVFLTEMMRQTAGDEDLELFVSVDEADFLKGQTRLLNNLKRGNAHCCSGSSSSFS